MNKLPLPLRLVISVVVIAALGIGSFFVVGAIVNPAPAAVAEPAETEVVPVYAPTSYGELDDASTEVAPEDVALSAEVGSIEVVTAVPDGSGSDAELDALLDSIAAGGSLPEGEGEAEDLPSGEDLGVHIVGREPLADPCAPVDGTAPADCPEGTRSTVLALLMAPEPTVVGRPYPTVSSYPGQPQCPRVGVEADEVPFGVRTNNPSDITVTYWPVADPGTTQTLTLRTTAAWTRAWNELLETAPGFASWWTNLDHCGVLADVRRGVEYAYDVIARDDSGRTVTQPTGFFVAGESSDEPLPRVFPASPDTFVATVPHRADEVVEIRAWWVDPLAGLTNCDTGPNIGGELRPTRTPQTWEVSEEFLASNGYDLEFTRSTMAAFNAPEGSSIYVCMRWFDADAASWDRDRALREATTFLQSPDQLVPTFRLRFMEHSNRIGVNETHYTIGTVDDEWCETWVGPNAAELGYHGALAPERSVLCDGGDLLGHNWTTEPVVLLAGRVDGKGATGTASLDLGVEPCVGTCELPAARQYRIGTLTGDDQPASFMIIDLTWSQGNQNGQRDWTVHDLAYYEGAAAPEFAQLDTDAEIHRIHEAGVLGISFFLRADRPAAFTARVFGDCFGDDTVREVTGTAPGDGTNQAVIFSDLCRGSVYWIEVQLTDAVGTSVFSPYVPPAPWNAARASANWAGGRIELDPVTANLSVSVDVTSYTGGGSRAMEVEASLLVGYRNVDLGIPEDGCMRRPFRSGPIELDDVELRENVRVLLTFRQSGGGDLSAGAPVCEDGERGAFMVVSTSVPLADLLAGTVRIHGGPLYPSPSPYDYEITIERR